MRYDTIVVQPLPTHKYIIKKPILYKDIIVPEGYITNGADIPRIFWSIVPPNDSNILPAVIIHDFLIDKKEYKKADRYFKEIMIELNINKIKRNILYLGVRFYTVFIRPFKRG